MYHIFRWLLQQFISVGIVHIQFPSGDTIIVSGDIKGHNISLGLKNKRSFRRLICNPELALGELYMAGDLWVIDGTLEDLMIFIYQNKSAWKQHRLYKIAQWFQNLARLKKQINTPHKSTQNVAHHYDLDDRLYNTFLDPWRQYSCAYFSESNMTLDVAQELKLARLGAKLCLKPSNSVLDIGCGWGGLAHALSVFEQSLQVTGITLSKAQYAYAKQLPQSCPDSTNAHPEFLLEDYRNLNRQFDRIISVGMFEHVGLENYPTFFQKIASSLRSDGVAVIHTIGRFNSPQPTNPWIEKYIFPGGYLPNITELHDAICDTGLIITDIEIMRLHYAETLKAWRHRFEQHRDKLIEIYDDKFARMWEFYLLGSEYYFRSGAGMVLQIQLAHRQDAVPLTRDYISKTADEYVKRLCQAKTSGKKNPYLR